MAERLAYLEAVVGADITQFRKGMRDIRNETGILSETISGLSGAARTATFAISAPLATLGTYTVQAASDFDAAMRNINSITGMSEGELKKLSDAVRDFSSTTRGGAVDAANSLYTVFSAGVTDIELAMNTMEVATKTADAGLADMETTTEALVASMLSYGTEVVSAERASDSLTQMVQIGVGSMQNFANSLSKALPSAAALGVEIEDLYASMAYMTQRSFSASEAATAINQGMSSLMKPTEDMEKAMRSLGANGVEELMDKYNSLGDAVKALVDTTDGSSASIAKLFSNIRGKRFVDTILNDFETYKQTMEEFNRTVVGATDRAYAEQMKSFAAQWDLMTSAVENASIAIGLELLPVLAPVIGKIAEIFSAISRLEPITLKMGVAFAGVAVVLPPLVWLLSSLLNPIGALVTLFGAVTANMVSAQGGITGFIDNLQNAVPEIKTIRREIDRIFGEPYQTEVPTATDLGLTGYETAPIDFATMQSGDTIWDYFLTRTDTNQTWDEFKDEWIARNGKLTFTAGDLVELPSGSFMEWVGDSIMDADELGEAYRKQRVYTSDFFEMNTDTEAWNVPMEIQMLQLRQTIDDNIKPAIMGIGTQLSGWFSNSFDLALTAIDEFGAELMMKLVDFFLLSGGALALGIVKPTVLSDKIGELFDIDLTAPFKNIKANLQTFVWNFYTWFTGVALPIVSRGVGRFTAEIANLGIKVISSLGDFLGTFDLTRISSIMSWYIKKPFMEGINDLFGARTLTILKNKFEIAGLKVAIALGKMFDQIKTRFNKDSLSDLIGNIFDFDPKGTFPTLFPALLALFDNISNWLFYQGVPMVAKGAGRFIGEFAILLVRGFESLTRLLNLNTLIPNVIQPIVDGFFASFDDAFEFASFMQGFENGLSNIITFVRQIFAAVTGLISPTFLSDLVGLAFNIDSTTMMPTVTANLRLFLEDISDWFTNDALPIVARGVGRFVGEMVILVGKGLANVTNFALGGDLANLGAEYITGFGEALVANDVTDPLDVFVTNLAGALVTTIGISTAFGSVAGAVKEAVVGAIGKLKFVQVLVDIALNLVFSRFLTAAFMAKVTAAGGWAAFIAGGLKAGLKMGLTTMAASVAGGFGAGLSAIGSGIAAAGSAIAGAPLTAVLAVVVGLALIAGFFSLSEENRTGFIDGINSLLQGQDWVAEVKVDMLIEAGEVLTVDNLAELIFTQRPDTVADYNTLPEELKRLVLDAYLDDFSINELDLMVTSFDIALDEGLELDIENPQVFKNSLETAMLKALNEDVYETALRSAGYSGSLHIPEPETELNDIQSDVFLKMLESFGFSDANMTASGIILGQKASEFVEYGFEQAFDPNIGEQEDGTTAPLLDVSEIDFIDQEEINQIATDAGFGFTSALQLAAASGLSPEEFKTDVLTPFANNWVGVFGEAGTARIASNGFINDVTVGLASLSEKILTTANDIVEPGGNLCAEFEKIATCIKNSMDTARDSVSKLLEEFRKLASISTDLRVNVVVTGTINAPAPTEDTEETPVGATPTPTPTPKFSGMDYVPRNGLLARLHRGEMVVPASLAEQMRQIGDMPASMFKNKSGYNNGINVTNVYIEGTVGVDELMEELERRGITL